MRVSVAGVTCLVLLVAACSGDGDETTAAEEQAASGIDGAPESSDEPGFVVDPVAGVDLSGLGAPPDAAPGTAVVSIDGTTTVLDGAALPVARCQVAPDSIAVNIGQSGPWLQFVATKSGESWTQGPEWQLGDDPPQYEGIVVGSEIAVDGERVTFQGEIVIKTENSDFDTWERTVGSLAINCASS